MAQAVYVFGTHPDDTQPQEDNFLGASGWYSVPTQWAIMTDSNQQIWASPNTDFNPKYACKQNGLSGELVFQDCYRNRYFKTDYPD